MTATSGKDAKFYTKKAMGLVNAAFTDHDLAHLTGSHGIGLYFSPCFISSLIFLSANFCLDLSV